MITVFNTLKKGFVVNKSVDFRSRFMTLDAAKDILSRCVQVSGQTIQFGNRVWSLILGDLDAIELLEAAYAKGWSSNEPDISVVGDTGYDGRVFVNNAIMQLTQSSDNTEVWYSTSTTAITSLAWFCLNTTSYSTYNSTACSIKRVRFGKNINTANMTSLEGFAQTDGTPTPTIKYEYFDVRHLNTANVTRFNRMFNIGGAGSGYYTPYINGIENFDTGKGTTFEYMLNSTNYQNKEFDLRKWKVLSNANLNAMFGRLSQIPLSGNNIKFYYRPSNWAKDPLDDSNITADLIKPVVFPYYPITVASSAPSSQKIFINNSSLVSMTYDSSNGVCYYNPSDGSINSLRQAFYQSNNSTANTVKSISFGQNIKNKLSSSFSQNEGTFAFLGYNTLLRTMDVSNWMQALQDMNKPTMNQLAIYEGNAANYGNRLRQIWGTEVINNVSCTHNSLLRGQQGIRFVDLGENVTSTYMNMAFRFNTNLVRITNLPSIPNGINTTSAFEGCTSLTTIDTAGDITETVSFSDSPLSLASAKVILRALKTVSGETIQFSDHTWSLILGDPDTIELLERAYDLGWNSNEPNISVVGDVGYDGRVYVNNAIMQLTQGTENTSVWYSTSTAAITSLAGFCMNTSSIIDSSAGRKIKRVRFGKNINTTNMTDCTRFAEVSSSIDQTKYEYFDVRHLNTSNVTSFNRMFNIGINTSGNQYYTPYINGIENFDTGKCTDFSYMLNSTNYQNKSFDLRKWKVLSNATITVMFGYLSEIPVTGNNIKFYYRPSNWAKDPLDDNNLTSNTIKPVVFPYYPITVASSAPSSQKIWINNSSLVSMSYDSSNGVCYYNPSNGYITTLRMAFFSDSSHNPTGNTVKSISFGQNIKNKLSSSFDQSEGTFAFLGACTLLRTMDVSNWMQALQDINKPTMSQLFIYSGSSTASGDRLRQVWGTEVINNVTCVHNGLIRGQQGIRFIDLGENVITSNIAYAFRNCTNLVRITNLPSIPTGKLYNDPFENCTSLTTIDTAGDITETVSFASSPLSLTSAKVILRALKTVSGKTCTFSSTTKGYINADSDALSLVTAARGRGWTIPLT